MARLTPKRTQFASFLMGSSGRGVFLYLARLDGLDIEGKARTALREFYFLRLEGTVGCLQNLQVEH